ncbi:MAG: hypothetical protein WC030_00605 [Candidatus Paceibacterota bacterium]
MSEYLRKRPSGPTFSQKGLAGYQLPILDSSFEAYEVYVEQGHDNYIVSKRITHTYFVIEGSGIFNIDGEKIEVEKEDLIEVPPQVEYTYTGKMRLLLFMTPPWFEGNEIVTKPNPDVK